MVDMQLRVSVEAEGRHPRNLVIRKFPCSIGRRREHAISLPSWRVAGLHAEIHSIEKGLKLVDCGSLGGTWVNGIRIAEHLPLLNEDEIVIAGFCLRVQLPTSVKKVDMSIDRTTFQRNLEEDCLGEAPLDILNISTNSENAERLEWRKRLHSRLLSAIDLRRQDIRRLTNDQLRGEMRSLLLELLEKEADLPVLSDRNSLMEEVLDEAIGLGPLEPLMKDASISEIMVNACNEIFIEREGLIERTSLVFSCDDAVRATIERIVSPLGRRIDESSPMVDARLPDGSRVNAVIPPLAMRGPAITIRRFNKRLFSPKDLVENGTISADMLEFLHVAILNRKNIIVSGGTGSGKTTLLNLLSNLIPEDQRVITIEDSAELRLHHSHHLGLEARPANAEGKGLISIRDLVRNALRMRPDRIVVGECRGGEALDMLQAMNTGHDGSLTTVHANSSRDVISRLEVMVLMSGVEIPIGAIREQIASAVDVIVHQARTEGGGRRVLEITEITGMEGSRVLMQPLFRFERMNSGAHFISCGNIPEFYEELRGRCNSCLDLSIFNCTSTPREAV